MLLNILKSILMIIGRKLENLFMAENFLAYKAITKIEKRFATVKQFPNLLISKFQNS